MFPFFVNTVYTVYTVDTVYIVYIIYTVFTIQTAFPCLDSNMYAYNKLLLGYWNMILWTSEQNVRRAVG